LGRGLGLRKVQGLLCKNHPRRGIFYSWPLISRWVARIGLGGRPAGIVTPARLAMAGGKERAGELG